MTSRSVTVKSAASGTVYEEGRDYEPLIDPHLNFRFDHRGPALRITTNSRIRDGDKLRLSYYQGFAINRYQVSICISEPQVYELWRAQLEMVRDVLDPAGYLLAMDEVRAGGWCRTCESDGLDAGERLGHTITRQVAMIDEVDPGSDVLVWSDMLDPNHNAHDDYFLYKGDFGGSWKHIPRGLIITCWYYDKRRASLRHFERLGFRTLAGAYYDADNLEKVKGWIADLEHTRGACGIMYTTWENKYGLLEQFGKLVTSQQSDSSKDG
jgi:hypothetical protein